MNKPDYLHGKHSFPMVFGILCFYIFILSCNNAPSNVADSQMLQKGKDSSWGTWNIVFKPNTTAADRDLVLYSIENSIISSVNELKKESKGTLNARLSRYHALEDSFAYQIKVDLSGARDSLRPPKPLSLDNLNLNTMLLLDTIRPPRPASFITCIQLNMPCN